MNTARPKSGLLTVIGGMILLLVLGSIHAFSVLLEPLETRFSVSRTPASATYSFALVSLTIAVLFSHHLFSRARPATVAVWLCAIAAFGCLLSAYGANIQHVWLGYSLLFGAANGIGYSLVLQSSAQTNPDHKGLAVGAITACYALGAVASPYLFDFALKAHGFPGAMAALAIALLIAGTIVPLIYLKANTHVTTDTPEDGIEPTRAGGSIFGLWLGYGLNVFAGLTIIGHATGVLRVLAAPDNMVLMAPILVAALNMAGCLVAGHMADRIKVWNLLIGLPVLSAAALLFASWTFDPIVALISLGMVGFAYGASISVYPIAVSNRHGPVFGVRVYGRVFTAWGVAGLAGPVAAGALFEMYGNYQYTLLLAALCGILSATIAFAWLEK